MQEEHSELFGFVEYVDTAGVRHRVRPKAWMAALLCALVAGAVGAHSFYLGYRLRGALQLVLFVFVFIFGAWGGVSGKSGCFFGAAFLIGVLWVWSFADFVRIALGHGTYFTDARGIPLLH